MFFNSDDSKRIDYVLVYKDDPDDKDARKKAVMRKRYEDNLRKDGIEIEYEDSGVNESCLFYLQQGYSFPPVIEWNRFRGNVYF